MSYDIIGLQEETKRSLTNLFVVNFDELKSYQGGEYFIMFGKPSKRIQSILAAEREILIIGNTFWDQQPRSIQFARKIIENSSSRLESTICIFIHQDPKGNSKLKTWGRESGISVLPIFTQNGSLPRDQEMERLLSFELFTQDPFDITGPVANDTQFFGRRTEAQEIARKLSVGHIRACFGIRKIGKTSLLHRILAEIENNYSAITVFVDCQRDDIFRLSAADLINSINLSLRSLLDQSSSYMEVDSFEHKMGISESARQLQATLREFDKPVILAFDEVDYITPSNANASHWRSGFVDFWRNVRAAYHAASRDGRKLSILVSGVSSRWFSVESIDGQENAVLSFVPEEYLSPLQSGAANAMIKSIGAKAGLRFDDGAQAIISSYCSGMPFWIRKACSFIHDQIDTERRPITVSKSETAHLLDMYVNFDGSSLAQLALKHLFRVYPEIKPSALSLLSDRPLMSSSDFRTLVKYGIASDLRTPSGEMIRAALKAISEEAVPVRDEGVIDRDTEGSLDGEWAEELALIGKRRNLIEKSLRNTVAGFIRFSALQDKGNKSAKQVVLESLNADRKKFFENRPLEIVVDGLYWLELVSIIKKNWPLFERLFGDKTQFELNADIINDRPDSHAKTLDLGDVAMYRRSLKWIEDKLAKG